MTTPMSPSNPESIISTLQRAAQRMLDDPHRRGSIVHLPGQGRLVVTGDLHDNPMHLQAIVTLARLDAGVDHHVILHEMIHSERLVNGVDLSFRMLVRAAQLVCDYPVQVHPLLANHELSQLTGSGVSKGAGNSVGLFHDGLEYVFDDKADEVARAISEFIRAMPIALRSASGLFCSHSLPSPRMMATFDSTVFDRILTEHDLAAPAGAAYQFVWGRGHTPEQINSLADAWDVSLFCIGHEHAEAGLDFKCRQLLVMNSDHARGVALPIDLASVPTAEEALLYAIPLRSVLVDEVG